MLIYILHTFRKIRFIKICNIRVFLFQIPHQKLTDPKDHFFHGFTSA